MFPMSNIGMTVGMWRDVIGINDKARITVDTMREYAAKEYGGLVKKTCGEGGKTRVGILRSTFNLNTIERVGQHPWVGLIPKGPT